MSKQVDAAAIMEPSERKKRRLLITLSFVIVAAGFPLVLIGKSVLKEELFSMQWFTGAGSPLGMAAVMLLSCQFVIAAKFRFLDRIFSLNRLFICHRIFGITAALCALAHPVIMFWPNITQPGPLNLWFWPGILGTLVFFSLCGAGFAALFRDRLGIAFNLWFPMHRYGAVGIGLLALVHFSFAEGHFEAGVTHFVLIAALCAYAVSFFLNKGVRYIVTAKTCPGHDTVAFDLVPQEEPWVSHAPGQFALVTFLSDNVPREEHPWTISSSPAANGTLQFTIKKSGDFTSQIDTLGPGDTAGVRGPYGLFSHMSLGGTDRSDLVMIAGGVGITPFLSMLRYLAATGDSRKIILVWSNKTEGDILWQEELRRLEQQLPGLAVHHVLTRQENPNGHTGRLTAGLLKTLVTDIKRDHHIFVCGPPPMSAHVTAQLKQCGFSPSRIHREDFRV